MDLKTILHPTDFSGSSEVGFRYAVSLAKESGALLLVLHAVETLGPEKVSYGEAVSRLQPQGYQQRLWQDLRQIRTTDPQVHIDYLLSEDEPVTAILQAADEHKCDLIVMGSHGRRGLRRLLLGSVAEKIVRAATCPVLVVKIPTESKQALPEQSGKGRSTIQREAQR
jgi:nucleotide-binding universal stress UspA family protein